MTDPRTEKQRDAVALDAAADLVEAQLALTEDAPTRIAWGRAYSRLQRMRSEILRELGSSAKGAQPA